jgi:hypothetical protein
VLGDGVLQVVDMRDTAMVGHRNFAIEPISRACPEHGCA